MQIDIGAEMNIEEKERLARINDMGELACARRLIAARLAIGIETQKEFAELCGVSQTSYNNMEKALQYPTRRVMKYLYRGHRIDFNFILNGDFSQLPPDIQRALFEKLASLETSPDRKQD